MLIDRISTPALIVDMDAMERNMTKVEHFCAERGVALRPHYKSHKSTYIAHLQLERGAKGICCAKLGEAEDLVLSGVEDVLIANQVIDKAKIARLSALANCTRLTVCVDSAGSVENLQAAAEMQGSTIHCLVEYDVGMNRCGVHAKEECLALARLIYSKANLTFDGIQAYAGNLAHCFDFEKRLAGSIAVEAKLNELKEYIVASGLEVKEISGMSTGTIWNRPEGTVYTEAQTGSYIFMDATYGSMNLKLENALFLLCTAIHASDDHIVFDGGIKSLGMDQNKPYFVEYPDKEIDFNEEHSAVYAVTGKVGDKARMVPGHCCSTVNMHDWLYLVRGNRVIDRIYITSRGKSE